MSGFPFDYLQRLGLIGYAVYLGPIVVVAWLLRGRPISRRNWLGAYLLVFLIGFGVTAVRQWRAGEGVVIVAGMMDGLVSSLGLVGFFNLIRAVLRERVPASTGVLGKGGGKRTGS